MSNLSRVQARAVRSMRQTATISREDVAIATGVPFHARPAVVSTGGMSVVSAVAGLGGGRASHLGTVPYGTDVADGDVITSDGRAFTVEGVGTLESCIGLALSEIRG